MADNDAQQPSLRRQQYDAAVAEQRARVAAVASDLEIQEELVSDRHCSGQLTACMQVVAVSERLLPAIMSNSHTGPELQRMQFVIDGDTMDMQTALEDRNTSRGMLARAQMALQSLLDSPPYEGPVGLHAALFPASGTCRR